MLALLAWACCATCLQLQGLPSRCSPTGASSSLGLACMACFHSLGSGSWRRGCPPPESPLQPTPQRLGTVRKRKEMNVGEALAVEAAVPRGVPRVTGHRVQFPCRAGLPPGPGVLCSGEEEDRTDSAAEVEGTTDTLLGSGVAVLVTCYPSGLWTVSSLWTLPSSSG
ncbi:hypothetical protein H1C71_037642 [Ictidomys tridecemlineatus]|nr:hypothetical protein H1C71_037642 [Ictidomys tridecemlineatus]